MNRLILTSLVSGLLALMWADVATAAGPKPASGKQSASQQRPDSSRRIFRQKYEKKKQSKTHQQVEVAKYQMTKAHTDVKAVEFQLTNAKGLEAKAKRDFERARQSNKSRMRREYDRYRANRANWQSQLDSAKAAYKTARAAYKQANRELQGERSTRWSRFVARIKSAFKRKPKPVGRRVNFAFFHMGPTGSGNPRPNVEPTGTIQANKRVSVVLERQPMPLN